jgi:hypothetical protein
MLRAGDSPCHEQEPVGLECPQPECAGRSTADALRALEDDDVIDLTARATDPGDRAAPQFSTCFS